MSRSDELVQLFVASVHEAAGDVTLDLTEEPVTIVARTREGRVFAAAWPTEDMLVIRLRLDAIPAAIPGERVEEGGLTYEVALRTPGDVEALAGMLRRAHTLTGPGDADSHGIHSP